MGRQRAGIFLYLADRTRGQFENTVAHGLRSISAPSRSKAVEFLRAFHEGIAMLAGAGSADRHPHAEDDALARARWDGDLMHFKSDVTNLQAFFAEVLDGKFKGDAAIMERAAPLWGDAQGAWYTVGYGMAMLVERRFGRKALLESMVDPRQLLALYNQVAKEANAGLALLSPELLVRLSSTSN